MWDFPESLSQTILVGRSLIEGLGVFPFGRKNVHIRIVLTSFFLGHGCVSMLDSSFGALHLPNLITRL